MGTGNRDGNVVILTGASSGIGEVTAWELAKRGYRLVLAARRADDLGQLAGAITRSGGLALPVPTDVCDEAQLERLVQMSLDHFGRIDVLINNAGVAKAQDAATPTNAHIDMILGTNLIAPMRLTRAVLPHMIPRRSGHIVNIGSVASYISAPGQAVYNASKHGMRAWNDTLRREMRPLGIKVSLVSPGFIRTPMTEAVRGMPMVGPETVARIIAKVISHPQREVITPLAYKLLIALTNALPGPSDAVMNAWRVWKW